jgi:hypothetical protein
MKRGNIIICIESFGEVTKGQIYIVSQDSEDWEEAVWVYDDKEQENVYSTKLFKNKITFYT